MNKILIRAHSGGLAESLLTVKEIEPTIDAVARYIADVYGITVDPNDVQVSFYANDSRIVEWNNTHIIVVHHLGVLAFTNGLVW